MYRNVTAHSCAAMVDALTPTVFLVKGTNVDTSNDSATKKVCTPSAARSQPYR